jgi:tRNA(fMet)-specific endonuclease VapC
MQTFLLDTCIWSYWFYGDRFPVQHANIEDRVKSLPARSILAISIITWGEAAHGQKVVAPVSLEREYLQFIKAKGPKTFGIDMHTALKYGELRAMLFEKYAPKEKRKKNLRPEQLVDAITGLEIGIQENDLWIAAQALVKNLTLVTSEKLTHIREVTADDLDIKDWAQEPGKD